VVLNAAGCRVTVRLLAHLVVPDLHSDLLHHMVSLESAVLGECFEKGSAVKLLKIIYWRNRRASTARAAQQAAR
jgi:hypothetical protein